MILNVTGTLYDITLMKKIIVNQNMKKGDKQNEEKPALLFPVRSCQMSKPEKKNLNQNQTLQVNNRTVTGQKSFGTYISYQTIFFLNSLVKPFLT